MTHTASAGLFFALLALSFDGKRWWIISGPWRAEDAKLSLPERYLEKSLTENYP